MQLINTDIVAGMEVTILLFVCTDISLASVSCLTSACVRCHELRDNTRCMQAHYIATDVVSPSPLERPALHVRLLFPA